MLWSAFKILHALFTHINKCKAFRPTVKVVTRTVCNTISWLASFLSPDLFAKNRRQRKRSPLFCRIYFLKNWFNFSFFVFLNNDGVNRKLSSDVGTQQFPVLDKWNVSVNIYVATLRLINLNIIILVSSTINILYFTHNAGCSRFVSVKEWYDDEEKKCLRIQITQNDILLRNSFSTWARHKPVTWCDC